MVEEKKEVLRTLSFQQANGAVLEVRYAIKRSVKARNIRLTIKEFSWILLTIPRAAKETQGMEFLLKKEAWIVKHLMNPRVVEEKLTLQEYMEANPWVYRNGERVPVTLTHGGKRSYCRVSMEDENVSEEGVNGIHINVGEADVGSESVVVEKGLIGVGKVFLKERVMELARKVKLAHLVKKVSVRNQKRVWGSCSCSGGISLNYRLLLVEQNLQDSVIYHELAHLLHMNHGPAFWKQVLELDPNYKLHDKKLKEITLNIISL